MQGKDFFKREVNRTALPFLVGLLIYSVAGLLLHLSLGKTEAHLWVNSYHFAYSDIFFKYITHLGDGLILVALSLLFLLVRYSWAIIMGVSGMLMGTIVQLLKRSVFSGDHRPAMFFPDGGLPQIDGVNLMLHHSFPSGHSATVFCVCFLLACFSKQRWTRYLLVGLALLGAFSRVYISQHFMIDTVVGGWIGFAVAYTIYVSISGYMDRNPNSKLNGRLWPS